MCAVMVQAEQLSKKGMQLTADKAAVESTLSLKEEEVRCLRQASAFTFTLLPW